MSSVRGEISGETLANEIRLVRANHKGSFLLVEGEADASLFKKFINESDCAITVCAGKENALKAIKILAEAGFEGALGILDKDFFDIVGHPEFQGAVLFTDHNDVEVMILCSEALKNVLLEFGIDDKKQALEEAAGKPVCDIIFDASAFLGVLRMLSLREKWNLRFEGMSYKFADANSFELDESRTVQHITGRSDAQPSISDEELVDLARTEKGARSNGREICCGHDCVRLLGRALRRQLGNTNLFNNEDGARNLGKILRIAYHRDQFCQTQLHQGIGAWEASSGYTILRQALTRASRGNWSMA